MKTFVLFLAVIFCFVFSCRKGIEFDKQYIRGRVFLTDTITGYKQDLPYKAKNVYLSTGDTLNYLYSAKPDNEGYFVFTLLSDKNSNYKIFAYDSIGTVLYSGSTNAVRGDKNLVLKLYPNTDNQNGVVFYAKDPDGASLPSVTYKLYNNESLALANSSTGFISIQADTSGKGFKLNLLPGSYWVNAGITIPPFEFRRIAKKIMVNATGFNIDTIKLEKKIAVSGFSIALLENSNSLVAGAEVRIYNNLSMAQINDQASVIGTEVSGVDGKITRLNLPVGTYYLNAYKLSGTDTLRRIAKQITINSVSILTDTMLLGKSSPPINGYRLQSKDSLGGILPVTTLFLYNSELLALQNSPTGAGSVLNHPTDNFGFGEQFNLPPGEYFVNARKQIDTVIYQRVAKRIVLTPSGVITDTIQLLRRR